MCHFVLMVILMISCCIMS
uniref:Uncharacterized protein n=1 Tax=Anguilla anguilla TaxID=7936 RepID=A0A0E9S6N4_ANGAN